MDYLVIIDEQSEAFPKFKGSIEKDVEGKYFWSDQAIYSNANIDSNIYFLVLANNENLKIAKTQISSKPGNELEKSYGEILKQRWNLDSNEEYLLKYVIQLKKDFLYNLSNEELWKKFKGFLEKIAKFQKNSNILIFKNYVSIPLSQEIKENINSLETSRDTKLTSEEEKELKNSITNFLENFIIDFIKNLKVITEIIKILKFQKQIILQGPPGTGKTYLAKLIAKLITNDDNNIKIVQFHPSYTYEDFIRGIKITIKNNQPVYEATDKIFAKICKEAERNPNSKYILIIDEINRANIPVVFGELIYALEYREEKIETPYEANGNSSLKIPKNLYIIGTMNTADRSIGELDYAVRRRFAFVHIHPNKELITKERVKELYKKLIEELFTTNNISPEFKSAIDDIKIGHSYFLTKDNQWEEELAIKILYQVLPILKEYEKDGIILEGKVKEHIKNIFGKENINIEDIKDYLRKGNQDGGTQRMAD